MSLSKAHTKLATRRNRLRRVARETFRNELLGKLDGHDIVIASRAGFEKIARNVVEGELKELLRRVRP